MTYAFSASFRATPGNGGKLVEILTRPSGDQPVGGCLVYEVGVGADSDLVYVIELWESEQAHAAALQSDDTKAAIAEAMPLLTSEVTGIGFEVLGSPLRGGQAR